MARGNDADTAAQELRKKVGGDYEGLDDLIRDYHASLDPRVQAAQLWGYDVEATDKLDVDSLKVDGGVVLSAAVRRNRAERLIIAVVEWENGRTSKVGLDYDSAPKVKDKSAGGVTGDKKTPAEPQKEPSPEAEKADREQMAKKSSGSSEKAKAGAKA